MRSSTEVTDNGSWLRASFKLSNLACTTQVNAQITAAKPRHLITVAVLRTTELVMMFCMVVLLKTMVSKAHNIGSKTNGFLVN
jgi:hypothetical protein